ncbi:MAG TPA: YggT family protein [Candidatus Dormibacteraeota bacterium]|jgi:uncharacterized protein YggT (Ycf19 family)
MERRDEIVEDPVTGTVREEHHVATGPAVDPVAPVGPPTVASSEVVSSLNPARRAVEAIYLVFGIIVGLLVIRMVLKLLGANAAAGFANFIYGVTDFFLAPFRNLLPTVGNSQAQLEMSVVIAILVYLLIAWVLARVIMIAFSRNVSVSRSESTGSRRRTF